MEQTINDIVREVKEKQRERARIEAKIMGESFADHTGYCEEQESFPY
jgi:hypothetical protein